MVTMTLTALVTLMLTVLIGHFDANSFGKTNVFLMIEGRVEVNPLNFA